MCVYTGGIPGDGSGSTVKIYGGKVTAIGGNIRQASGTVTYLPTPPTIATAL